MSKIPASIGKGEMMLTKKQKAKIRKVLREGIKDNGCKLLEYSCLGIGCEDCRAYRKTLRVVEKGEKG